MKIHLRERKLKNGKIRLYLDFYKGYKKKDLEKFKNKCYNALQNELNKSHNE